ncbi:MAG: N-acetylmuramoyl-L-alanine amidase [Gemmatimonadota bacterium]
MIRRIALLLALLGTAVAVPAAAVPAQLTIQTPRGTARLAVIVDRLAGPVVAGDALIRALNGAVHRGEPWVEVTVARQSFRFLEGAPLLAFNDRLEPLAGWAMRQRDSLYLPLQFVTEVLPRVLAERYQYDPDRGRLLESGPEPKPARPAQQAADPRLPNGLLPGHVVTVDAGHGGKDPGNPGLYFPRGVREKDVTLAVSLMLRDELRRRGVRVVMTRTTDTLINRVDRAPYCTNECDLFVSLHVDALNPSARRRYGEVSGFHTIIVGEENTEDADRIARMENDAVRYEDARPDRPRDDLDFILRNLQMNEYLRESARAAELVQEHIQEVHTGDNRGVKQSNQLAVLNTARRPAILVEMGYSTNPQDAKILTGRKSQQALATAIADAIVTYLLEYERKTTTGAGSGR